MLRKNGLRAFLKGIYIEEVLVSVVLFEEGIAYVVAARSIETGMTCVPFV
jgi:hypothetical protein